MNPRLCASESTFQCDLRAYMRMYLEASAHMALGTLLDSLSVAV